MKASLDPNDVTQRTLLNEVALEAVEDEFISDMVAPVQLVDLRSGRQYITSRTANRAEVSDELSTRGKAERIPSGLGHFDYDCKPYGLSSDVNTELAGEHPLLENVSLETRRVGNSVHLQQELRVVGGARGALWQTATYHSDNVVTLTDGFQWNGGGSANPVRDLNTALAAMIAPPTHFACSLEVWQGIQESDQLRVILSAMHAGLFTTDEFALYFGIEEGVVNRGQYASVSDPNNMTRILSMTDFALFHASASPKERSLMRQIRLRQGAQGIVTTPWVDYEPGVSGFTRIKVAHETHVVVIDNKYGALIRGARRVS